MYKYMYQPLGSDPVEMLKNTDRQKKKNVFFYKYFSFRYSQNCTRH